MTDLCRFLSARLNQKVVDKTAITGVFDIELKLASGGPPVALGAATDDSDAAVPDPGADIRDALQKLELRLESAKTTAEAIVIDHIERPSEN